jgi:FixJ family two-component response regulator
MNGGRSGTSEVRVFVVDDDSSLRASVARLVRSAGWEAETFGSARDFLDRPAYAGTGCVVLDVQMPGMSGPQLQDWMTDRGDALPVVFLTGHGDIPGAVEAMKKGAADYLLKPVDPERLLQTVDRAVQRHAAEQARRRMNQDIESRLARLSRREREVMDHVVSGQLNKQIADRMSISLQTVKAHRARVMDKMAVDSVAELVHLCDTVGLSPPEPGA